MTPILHDNRFNSDSALSSGSEKICGIEPRRHIKSSRRKPSATDTRLTLRQKRKAHRRGQLSSGWMDGTAEFLVRNQIRMSLGLMSLLAVTYALVPHLRPTLRKFYSLQYYDAETGLYAKGLDDVYLVFFWIVLFTFLRSTILDYVLVPLARRGGITTRKGVVRFSEQAWLVVYYGTFWGVGMYILVQSPYWGNMDALWMDWPKVHVDGLFKWYYLAQYAFWLQQIFVLNIEERRKDHVQMFAHHIITCALIHGSYTHHLMRVGHVILCVMDVIDILLSGAKLLKYLGYSTICDYAFGIFLIGWIIGRHGFYNQIVYSVWRDSIRIITPGCYDLAGVMVDQEINWQIEWDMLTFRTDVVCYTLPVQRTFLALLVGLQVITLVWLYMILRVAWRVVRGANADDTRSEDEGEEEEHEHEHEPEMKLHSQSAEKIVRMVSVGGNGAVMSAPPPMRSSYTRSHLPAQPLGTADR